MIGLQGHTPVKLHLQHGNNHGIVKVIRYHTLSLPSSYSKQIHNMESDPYPALLPRQIFLSNSAANESQIKTYTQQLYALTTCRHALSRCTHMYDGVHAPVECITQTEPFWPNHSWNTSPSNKTSKLDLAYFTNTLTA